MPTRLEVKDNKKNERNFYSPCFLTTLFTSLFPERVFSSSPFHRNISFYSKQKKMIVHQGKCRMHGGT